MFNFVNAFLPVPYSLVISCWERDCLLALLCVVFSCVLSLFHMGFDFTTAGDWDCVGAVERLPALYYSVDFIFSSFGIMGFNLEL